MVKYAAGGGKIPAPENRRIAARRYYLEPSADLRPDRASLWARGMRCAGNFRQDVQTVDTLGCGGTIATSEDGLLADREGMNWGSDLHPSCCRVPRFRAQGHDDQTVSEIEIPKVCSEALYTMPTLI